ncbi:MAG: scpB [Francisellaceae bacterium]|nr:scpB [Francisellaceae bacterium]
MRTDDFNLKSWCEAILLAKGQAMSIESLQALWEPEEKPSIPAFKTALNELKEELKLRAIELIEVASGYRIQIKQEWAGYIAKLWEEKPARYSRALLETLALVAYRQPITRGEIEEIRGVSVSSSIFKVLVEERNWIKVVGHKMLPGRPALYATTKHFLDYFGLKDLEQLPNLPEMNLIQDIPLEALEQQLEAKLLENQTPNPSINIHEDIRETHETENNQTQSAFECESDESFELPE